MRSNIVLGVFLLLGVFTCGPAPDQVGSESPAKDTSDNFAGFWLAQCIANWTGLITEMDKIGNLGDIKTGDFYTREAWGGPDQPSIFNPEAVSDISPTIDFVLIGPDSIWGADDDTDIEYLYQHLLYTHDTTRLSPELIAEGWKKHILPEEENYLWVSNQRAFDLMREGVLPPATSDPANNEHFAMIDAQLTTEIFGLYAPGDPTTALDIAHLPIRVTARGEAAEIAEFNVIMYSLVAGDDTSSIASLADRAREYLTDSLYPAKMYDFVKSRYLAGVPWEQTRDEVYQRYQVEQADGYDISAQGLYCNGCFAAGINFAASIVSLLYGEGDLKETIKIGALAGWDSDNPTATWAGMLGYRLGVEKVEELFGRSLSRRFNIHRTRQNFPHDGLDSFPAMAERGVYIQRKVVGR